MHQTLTYEKRGRRTMPYSTLMHAEHNKEAQHYTRLAKLKPKTVVVTIVDVTWLFIRVSCFASSYAMLKGILGILVSYHETCTPF